MNYELVQKVVQNNYTTEEGRLKFIARVALTFGLKITRLSIIFGIDMQDLEKRLLNRTPYRDSLEFLFHYGIQDQEKAESNFWQFFNELYQNLAENNLEGVKRALYVISDQAFLELKRINYFNKKHSDEEIIIILKYQLKYSVRTEKLCNIYGIHPRVYTNRVLSLPLEYQDLVEAFLHLKECQKSIRMRGI